MGAVGIVHERGGQDAVGAARVELDHEAVGVAGHIRHLAGLERLVQADAVGADLVEEGEVVVGDAELGKDVGGDVEDDLHAVGVRACRELGGLVLDLLRVPFHGQQAREDAGKAVRRRALDVRAVLLNRRMLGIQRDSPLHTPARSFSTCRPCGPAAFVCI